MNKFEIKSLNKSFDDHHVLQGIDLVAKDKSSLVILGGSGSGKSVLIKLMIGLLTPDKGSILYNGKETVGISEKERADILKNCGYLFQSGALFDSLTIEQNVIFFAKKLYNLSKTDLKELAISKISSVGLPERVLNLYPSELSGGMQKRAALARSICTNPEVIFFDEPTTGLDPIMSNVINDLIIKIREELNATTITITHDMHSAKRIGKEAAFLESGKIIWSGDIEDINNNSNEKLQRFVTGSNLLHQV